MSDFLVPELEFEPERYELHEANARVELDRRDFLRMLGAGILVLCLTEASEAGRAGGFGGAVPQNLDAWLHLGETGIIKAFSGKVEVGQGARTELTQVVAEELHVAPSTVQMVLADTALVPYDAGTFGSGTTPRMVPQLRRAAAAARELLLDLAAEQIKVDRTALVVADGRISHPPSRQTRTFAELAKGQTLTRTLSGDLALTPPDRWRVAGHSLHNVNAKALVTGQHRFASDVKRPGLLYGKVLRPAKLGATLASVDTRAAETRPGVHVVRDGDFVGVVAPTSYEAQQALDALRAEWTATPQVSSRELFEHLRASAPPPAPNAALAAALANADHRIEQTYTIAYIAHAPLEPRAAVAEWEGDKLTVWTGTQRPFGVRSDLANALRIPPDRVRVIVPDTGSGYGGKHTTEAATEAARLAKAAGKPVKVTWTREEEMTFAYFRPAGVIDVRAGVRNDGALVAWDFHNVNSGGSSIRALYEIPQQRSEFHGARSPLKQGSYRALAATANHFARESVIDDLARLVKLDPLAFRLKNLKDERLRAVLIAAADRFGWTKAKSTPTRGLGLACGFEKGSYVANCAEVALADGKPRITRVVVAFECGAVINPDNLRNQIEGSIVQGIGGALWEAIEFAEGKILNPRFSQYRVPRFSDTPIIETVLLDRKDLPSAGAGETPIVAIAPAIGNALCAATGTRLRSLPMMPRGGKV